MRVEREPPGPRRDPRVTPQAGAQGLRSELTSWYQMSSVMFRQRVPGRPPRPSEPITKSSAMKKILEREKRQEVTVDSSADSVEGMRDVRGPPTRTTRAIRPRATRPPGSPPGGPVATHPP